MTQDKFLEKLKENIKWKSIVAERFTENARGRWFVGIDEKSGEDDDSDTD